MLVVCLVAPCAAAQGTLAEFLEPVQNHPAVLASAAALAAAQAQVDGAYSPVSATLSGGFQAFDNDDIDLDPETPGMQGLPKSGGQFSADLSFRPFPFGDIADLVEQRQLALLQARLDYNDTLTDYESQALTAALNVQLAQESLELAGQSVELAQTALAATQLRFEKGAASERDVRDGEANLTEAQNFAQTAASNLELARLTLRNLVGEVEVPALPGLPIAEGTAVSVQRSRIGVELAQVGKSGATRELIPVAQAGYTFNLDGENTLELSLESRTLQPSVGYSYQNPGRQPPQTAQNGSFQIGVSANLDPALFRAAEAARDRVAAAQAGLQAAQDGAEIQRQALENALTQARQTLELREVRFRNTQVDFEEAQTREELGITTPLETLNVLIELLEDDLELRTARQEVLAATLDFYAFYGVPVSEVIE